MLHLGERSAGLELLSWAAALYQDVLDLIY